MQFAHHAPDAAGRERCGQGGRRVLLALVGLIENRHVVRRQERPAGCKIEEEQRVVDDDDIGEARRIAAFEEMAVGETRAELAHAIVGIGVERFPVVATRRERELRAIARFGAIRPQPELLHRRARRDEPLGAHLLVLLPAQVVIATLEQFDARRNTERVDDERDVLAHELLLQRDRAGGDHDLLPRTQRRHEIGERFADAGARLDERVDVLEDPALDQLRHLHLTRTRFKPRQGFCDGALRTERFVDLHQGCGVCSGDWSSGECSIVTAPGSGPMRCAYSGPCAWTATRWRGIRKRTRPHNVPTMRPPT
jgi:hypothetical protein